MEGIGIGRARDRAADADLRIFLGSVPDEARDLISEGDLFVETKGDLTGISGAISSQTGEGVDLLLDQIFEILRERVATSGVASHARQAEAMQAAVDALDMTDNAPPELLAEAMREALHHLQRLVGKVDVDDYLDRVFSTFCVGK